MADWVRVLFQVLLACSGGVILAEWIEDRFQEIGDINPGFAALLSALGWASLVFLVFE